MDIAMDMNSYYESNNDKFFFFLVRPGSTCYFFRDSDNKSDYRKMWEKMQFSSEEDGIDRITKDAGGFAFFLESKAIEYIQERRCTVTQVGNLLDTKGMMASVGASIVPAYWSYV